MTPDQVRAKFKREGKTVRAWAEENNYDPNRVYRVLGGFDKCLYGKGHDIAVALGIKKATPPSVD
jgi:gp16 family phage-associated protein